MTPPEAEAYLRSPTDDQFSRLWESLRASNDDSLGKVIEDVWSRLEALKAQNEAAPKHLAKLLHVYGRLLEAQTLLDSHLTTHPDDIDSIVQLQHIASERGNYTLSYWCVSELQARSVDAWLVDLCALRHYLIMGKQEAVATAIDLCTRLDVPQVAQAVLQAAVQYEHGYLAFKVLSTRLGPYVAEHARVPEKTRLLNALRRTVVGVLGQRIRGQGQ